MSHEAKARAFKAWRKWRDSVHQEPGRAQFLAGYEAGLRDAEADAPERAAVEADFYCDGCAEQIDPKEGIWTHVNARPLSKAENARAEKVVKEAAVEAAERDVIRVASSIARQNQYGVNKGPAFDALLRDLGDACRALTAARAAEEESGGAEHAPPLGQGRQRGDTRSGRVPPRVGPADVVGVLRRLRCRIRANED